MPPQQEDRVGNTFSHGDLSKDKLSKDKEPVTNEYAQSYEEKDCSSTGSEASAVGSNITHQTGQSSQNDIDFEVAIASVTKRSRVFAALVVLAGLLGSAMFLTFGLQRAEEEAEESFSRRASELTALIDTTWREYEHATLATHNMCRRSRKTTRKEFREFYEYLLGGGLEFESCQCSPNVTRAERAMFEADAREFYDKEYPSIDYSGFIGFAPDPATGELSVIPSPELDFYFPVHYLEPVLPNQNAIDLDMYSFPSQQNEINLAVQTRQPVLSKRLQVVNFNEASWSVIIYHPGIYLETDPDEYPSELSLILVRVPSLLERVAQGQQENLGVYLYDTTPLNTAMEETPDFLGAAKFLVSGYETPSVEFIDDLIIDDVYAQHTKTRLYEEEVQVTASGTWHIMVVPVDDSYEPDITFVIFGGAMIILAALGMSIWILINMRKVVDIYEAKQESEAERLIVYSLFPENIRRRMMESAGNEKAMKQRAKRGFKNTSTGMHPEDYAPGGSPLQAPGGLTSEALFGSKPIADYHPEVTIMCADLIGFTAWSSVREPSQVFTLLEVLFYSFDQIAKKFKVFKVETVGDSYVAVTGLPVARKDHAVNMARFANECLKKMHLVVSELETNLGPDTGNLAIRIGLHSGAVTAGVLRGDKGRFQLFGDTINTASRMETTGYKNRIQVSPDTAQLLKEAGKDSWLKQRRDTVFVKGKGELTTFYLQVERPTRSTASSAGAANGDYSTLDKVAHAKKNKRLIKWNVEELCKLLKQIVAWRESKKSQKSESQQRKAIDKMTLSESSSPETLLPLEKVKDIITLPEFDPSQFKKQVTPEGVTLDEIVVKQLTDYVEKIANMYQRNPFHNYEHASHVAMSVTKLLTRIVNPKQVNFNNVGSPGSVEQSLVFGLHDHTLGITSDPLTQFAAFFCAMIHDVDHPGVPNTTLMEEDPLLAEHYKMKSIAEQKSIDIAWSLLMEDSFLELRQTLFGTRDDLLRFHQLVINMVCATDVMDKELNAQRKGRWNIAFAADENESSIEKEQILQESQRDKVNRKATIVIEHLIQASDVSHTMQHWHIYRKWNERLFMELYHAYRCGRLDKDPSENWYEGEKGFLDFYVLPLAKKLDTCGVFGVSSDEFRIYAMENRKEWEIKGKEIIKEYLKIYNQNYAIAMETLEE